MNKNLYRIIFNQRRGQMMAVSETATAIGKTASGEGTRLRVGAVANWVATIRPLCLSVLASLGVMMVTIGSAGAQVIADPNAPGNQRPTVLQTTNGLPQINIQTPSAAGVSRNTYRQFDIQNNGAILNNARTNAQTQLGGWVQGNPWLATGSARVILNEVNSATPSQLRGYIEVAGQRAEVIIANPAGVNADGAGFINASRVTLTTGTPQISGGNLEGYLVQRGTVTINGKGLDATLTDYTGILARAVQINARIWAKDLNIVTGANQINAEHTTHTATAGTGAAPTFALDVAQLGGMYAGKITLIGTESGVGVRNAGVIGATAGDVDLRSDGWLTNSGSIQALGSAHSTQISTVGDVTNSGTIYATGNTSVKARGNISLSGLVAAQNHATVVANGATSQVNATSSAVLASGLNSNGTLGAVGDLQVQGSTSVAIQGKTASAGNTHIAGSQLDLSGANVSGAQLTLSATSGDLNAIGAAINAQGTLTAQTPQILRTEHAQVTANQINISAHDLSNIGGRITQSGTADLTVQLPGNLNNSQGHIATNSQHLTLGAVTLTHTDGKIEHAGTGALSIAATTFDSQRGITTSNGAFTLNAANVNIDSATTTANQVTVSANVLSNRAGHISQTGVGQTTINASQRLDNTTGKIETNGNATISAATLVNHQGRITAALDANISASSTLDNTDGAIVAAQDLKLNGGNLDDTRGTIQAVRGNATINVAEFNNSNGNAYAGGNLNTSAANVTDSGNLYAAGNQLLNVSGTVNNTGLIAAQGDNAIAANSVNSSATSVLGAGIQADGTLATAGNLSVTTTQGLSANGQNLAAGNATLTSASVDLSGSQTYAANIAATAISGNVTTDNATINTPGMLSVIARTQDTQSWSNARGRVNANQLNVQVANLNNTQGELVQTGAGDTTINLTSPTGTLDNTLGRIAVNSNNLTFGALTLTNTDGTIEHAGYGTLAIIAPNVSDQRGLVVSNGALTVNASNVDHRNATMVAEQIAITASNLDNRNGQIVSRGLGASALTLNLDTLNNQQGVIDAAGSLAVTASGTLDNQNGTLLANENLSLTSAGLNNTDGVISAIHTVDVHSTGRVLSNRGQITSDGDVTLAATGLDLTDGVLSAKQAASVQLGSALLTNTRGQLIGAQSLTVQSGEIQNAGGRIATGSALALDTQGNSLNNDLGQIVAVGSLSVNSAQLNNTGGTVASLNGNLTANTNGQSLINDAGKLQAKLDTILVAGTTSNQSGGLISGHNVSLTSGAFNNQSGLVVAGGDLTAATLALNNDRGLLQAVGSVTVNTHGNGLSNTNSGSTGGVIAGATVTLYAGSLDNRAGYLGSNGNQTLNVSGLIDNGGGQVLSNGNTTIAAADLLNVGGRIHALGGIDATITTLLDNRAGQVITDGAANLRASTIDNSAGYIEAANLGVNANALRNVGGSVIAGNDAGIYANLDNSGGLISAKHDLTVSAPTLNNAGGRLIGDNSLTVTTGSGSFGGILASANALNLLVNGDYVNTGLLSAQKRLSVTANNIDNSGTLTAGQSLGLTTGNLTNSGEISAPTTVINASGTLTNTGLIDGYETTVRAGTLNNTGRIYGDWLSIGGGTLNNSGSGTLAARQDLQIGAYALNNIDGALIYSLGDIAIAGALDANGVAQGSMANLLNASSRIEARGNLTIAADYSLNRNDALVTELVTGSSLRTIEVQPAGWAERYLLNRFIGIYGGQDKNQFIVHPDLYGQRTTLTPVYTFTPTYCDRGGCHGGDLVINYTWSSPEFSLLGVTSPGAPPVAPAGLGGCTFNSSAECRAWRTAKSAWNAQLDRALDELAVAITAYNIEVKEDNRTVQFEDYRVYDITAKQSRSQILSTRPGELLAGGSLIVDGALTNQDSHVIAGGAVIAAGPAIQSLASEGEQRTVYNGTTQSTEVVACGTFGDDHCREWSGVTAFNPAPLVETFSLPSVRVEQYAANPTAGRDLTTATAGADTSLAAATSGATSNGRSAGNANMLASLIGPAAAHAAVVGGVNTGAVGTLPAGSLPMSSNRQAPMVVQVLPVDHNGVPAVILTSPPALSLPSASLFVLHGEPSARFVVETDPRFTDRRQFLSSDYYLQQLQLDPAYQHKRLGDGFYEQQLINDQVLALTGRRFLTGYANAEAQYRALMNAGVLFVQQFQLTPGVVLTPEHMALLTTDMVVLTTQTVRLPDGRSEQVLAPQLYLRRAQAGDLTRSSALIAGSDVYLNSTGDLINSGAIAADQSLVLHAGKDLINTGGRLSGQDIYARAENDLNNLSGIIQGVDATGSVNLQAGRDLVLQTRTIQTSNAEGNSSRVNVDRIAVVQGGNITLDAARNLMVAGALVSAGDHLVAVAGNDLRLNAVAAHYQIEVTDADGRSTQGRRGYVTEGSTTQQLGSLQAGSDLTLLAQGNVTITGGVLAAGHDLLVQGANIDIEAVRDNTFHDSQFIGKKSYQRTARAEETLAGGIIAADNNVSLIAVGTPSSTADPAGAQDGNINLTGVNLAALEGQLTLAAENDVRIQHLSTASSALNESYVQSGNALKTTTSVGADSVIRTTAIGSSLEGQNVLIQSGNDVSVQASVINADQALIVHAKRDVNLIAAQDTHSETHVSQTHSEATGLAKGIAGAIALIDPIAALTPNSPNQVAIAALLTKKNQTTDQDNTSTTAVGSQLTGGSVDVQSGRDTQVQGSTIVADGDLNVIAGRNLTITTAENTQAGQFSATEKTTGLLRFDATGNSIGKREQDQAQQTAATYHTASQIVSLGKGGESGTEGNVNLLAIGNNTITGSSILAPGGDITIAGSTVLVDAAHNSASQASQTHYRETAATVQLKSGYVEAIKGAYEAVQTAQDAKDDTGSDRMAGLAALNAAMSVYNAYIGIQGSATAASQSVAPLSAISISGSIGASKSDRNSTSSQSTAQGAQLAAGGAINVSANGDAASGNGNLTMIGANLSAGQSATLSANGKIDLLAAENTTQVHSSNNSSNASLGATFALGGSQNGFSFQIGAQGARGLVNGEETTYSNTQIRVGDAEHPGTLTIQSGGDTTLRGASANADRITTDIGGNLLIESLKDKIQYDSQQQSIGGGVSLCIPPICYGQMVAVSVNAAESKIKADHDSVAANDEQRGQSGLKAGDGGFEVKVGGNTTLIGGVISSTDSAVNDNKNSFQTGGTLTTQDIANHSELDAYSVSAGMSTGSKGSSGSFGYGEVSDSQSSVTQAGISGIAGNIDARTGDTDTGIQPVFTSNDAEQVNQSLSVQTGITAAFGQNAAKVVGDIAASKMKPIVDAKAYQELNDKQTNGEALSPAEQFQLALLEKSGMTAEQAQSNLANPELQQDYENWKEGGAYRVGLHIIAGAMGGGVNGAIGAGVSAAAAPLLDDMQAKMEQSLIASGMNPDTARATASLIAVGTAAAAGGLASGNIQGATTAANIDLNNRQLHPDEQKWLRDKAKEFARKEGITEQQAMERLTQQALKEVDYLWRAQLKDGDDVAAKAFLADTKQTFTNDLGEQQKLFSTSGQQLFRPEMFADVADPAFYQQFAQSGISRRLTIGIAKELRDSGVDLKNGVVDLANAVKENPKAVLSAVWDMVKDLPEGVVAAFTETGTAIGEGMAVMLNDDLQAKLNAIYGTDVVAAQRTILAIRITTAITGASAVAKGAKAGIDASVSAGRRALDKIESEALEKAAIEKAKINNNLYREGSAMDFPRELKTSSGVVIQANPDKTTTVLGTFRADTTDILGNLDYVKSTLISGPPAPGSFNLLNVPDDIVAALKPGTFWEIYNKPFLDAAIQRGDDIVLATKPDPLASNVLYRPDGSLTGFGREYDYLIRKGYAYQSLTGMMVKK